MVLTGEAVMGEKMTSEREALTLDSAMEGVWHTRLPGGQCVVQVDLAAWKVIKAHLTQPAQAVDVGAIRCIAKLLRALSPDGEEWRSSNPNNAAVLDLRKLADKLTAALPKDSNAQEDTPDAAR